MFCDIVENKIREFMCMIGEGYIWRGNGGGEETDDVTGIFHL